MVSKDMIRNTDAIMADDEITKKAAEAPSKGMSGAESICLDDYLIPGDVHPWDVEVCYVYVPD